jgi:hypothetical protein
MVADERLERQGRKGLGWVCCFEIRATMEDPATRARQKADRGEYANTFGMRKLE